MSLEQSTVSIPQAIRIAMEHHQAGRLPEAEGIYRVVLQAEPQNAEALQLLGVIAHQVGRDDLAVELFDKALAIQPGYAEAWGNRGLSQFLLGLHGEALASFDRALAIRPDFAEALSNRGNALRELGRLEEALASYEGALSVRPAFAEALNNRGNLLKTLGRHAEALASFDRALECRPQYAEAMSNRGLALQGLERHDEAIASYDRALALNPRYAEALNNRGFALSELGRHEEALASLDAALALQPEYAAAHYNRGNALQSLGRQHAAIASYDKAAALLPGYLDAWNNRGNALKKLRRFEEALASYDRALAIDPGHAGAWSNRGTALYELKRYAGALESYAKALALLPDYADAHWNEGLCRLNTGDFEQGWKKIEWRWQTEEFRGRRRDFRQPVWLGQAPLAGKTILLHAEQGLGDAIQFSRYVPMVKARGGKVLLEVFPELKTLMESLEGAESVIARGEELPAFDFHCPLLSLPLAFGTKQSSIPATVPYLFADTTLFNRWRKRLGRKTSPRVGVVWSGNPGHGNDRNRSMGASGMVQALASPGIRLVSLQKEIHAEDLEFLTVDKGVACFGPELKDFSDTAALVSLMDLVVSVDTSVAHLAGALGKQVWILLPFAPDWRWMEDREDSPWYPGARLFRQPAAGDWSSVLDRVKAEIERKFEK